MEIYYTSCNWENNRIWESFEMYLFFSIAVNSLLCVLYLDQNIICGAKKNCDYGRARIW